MDATLVTAHSDKEGAAPTWKKGYGFHPLAAWAASTRECLAMLLRPGNAGSNTFTDHKEVLAAAIRQVPARFRRKILVRVDGAGASHELIKHLLAMSSPRRILLFTCGWMITAADEDAIRQVPADARKPGPGQDRTAKAMGLRNLPSKTWQVNCGWVLAANIAADLTAWARLLGFHDCADLREAEPDTLRYRIWHIPARLVHHARQRILKISPGWPWKDAFLTCWQRLCAMPAPA